MTLTAHEKSELLALAAGSTLVQIGLFLIIWQALFA